MEVNAVGAEPLNLPSPADLVADADRVHHHQHAALLRSLRADADPSAGFYARVLNRIDQQSQSVWSVFSDSLFAKRLAYASMTFVVLLGTYLVSTTQQDQQPYASSAPEVIIANDDHIHPAVGDNPQQNRETVLVNLASYQQ